jgi:NAD(P)H dehydrogenase (quinone)
VKILVILAHPDPGSFNHAIAREAARAARALGHRVVLRDLCREGFDPVLPACEIAREGKVAPAVARHVRDLRSCGGLVIVHPNWWGQPPAILKGWVDRVMRPGAAYDFLPGDKGEGIPAGLLSIGTALVFNTSNTPARREREVFGDPLGRLWAGCILRFCGVKKVRRKMFGVVVTSTPARRARWLATVRRMVQEVWGQSSKN